MDTFKLIVATIVALIIIVPICFLIGCCIGYYGSMLIFKLLGLL